MADGVWQTVSAPLLHLSLGVALQQNALPAQVSAGRVDGPQARVPIVHALHEVAQLVLGLLCALGLVHVAGDALQLVQHLLQQPVLRVALRARRAAAAAVDAQVGAALVAALEGAQLAAAKRSDQLAHVALFDR